jgi:hypothetical protein
MGGDRRSEKAKTPPPQSLADAEATATHDVRMFSTNTTDHDAKPETAYQALRSDYEDFKKTHNAQDVQKYVTDLTKKFKDEGWLPDLAVAFGYDREYGKGPNARLSDADLTAMANDKDPLTAALGKELKGDVASIKKQNPGTKQEGGFAGFNTHDAPGLGRDDLNVYLDNIEHVQRARELGSGLLSGGNDSVFNQVARAAGKNPDDPNQPLKFDDFDSYYSKNSAKMTPQQREFMTTVLENWGTLSLNTIAGHFDGDTILSKKSIQSGLNDLRDSPR